MKNIKPRYSNEYLYNRDYVNWKDWEGDFGDLSKSMYNYYDLEFKGIISNSSSQLKVLEIGFGSGDFLKYAKIKNWDVLGLEVNEILVDLAKENGFNVLLNGSLETLDSETFDLVVAFDVLEHLCNEQIIEMVAHLRRVLKKGGCFLSRFPNGDSPLGLVYQNGDLTHKLAIGSGKVKHLAKLYGFEIVRINRPARQFFKLNFFYMTHSILYMLIQNVGDLIISKVFFPGQKISYFSPNLVAVLKVNE